MALPGSAFNSRRGIATSSYGGMTDANATAADPLPHRSRGFIVGYGAAQAGAFITFIPLLALLLPEKARDLAGPDGAGLLLSQAAMVGGLTATVANLLFGALSDRTRTPFGRRRPWIIGGFAGVALSMVLIAMATGPVTLILSVVVFQLGVNALYGPLMALVPDLVPNAQKGLVSAWAGAALPVANLFTALVISRFSNAPGLQYLLVVLAAGLLILPFTIRVRERWTPPRTFRFSFAALADRRFSLAFVARLLAESAVAINTLYLLLWLQTAPPGALPQGWSAAAGFSVLLIGSTLAGAGAGFVGGMVSDRLRHRRAFVIAGALGMAVALAILAAAPPWPAALLVQILFGAAHGLHATTVAAMTAEILPDPEEAGRDLGVMNMAIALPQSLAPALAAVIFTLGLSMNWIFAAASVAAVLAAAALMSGRWRAPTRT